MSDESRRATVLVIDDEIGPRESLRMVLKDDYAITCVDRADDGIRLLQELHPDLVILDIRMPDKDGIEALKEIRELDQEVSVVMLTGFGALETAQQAMRLGANDYLNKPFDTNEIREVAKRYTQRSRVERRRAGMMSELRQLNERLANDLADSERLASIGRSSSEIVHDMRNPLMIVSGYIELLALKIEKSDQAGSLDEVSQYLDVIGENVKRCCELAQMWSRIGKSELGQFQPTRLSDVMTDVEKGVTPLADADAVQMDYDYDDEVILINGSRAQLVRAVHNIIANAIHASAPSKGRIIVSTGQSGEHAFVRVRDNGCGMSDELMKSIFEPYFTTKPEGQGTGLGMVITKKVVDDHAGDIAVKSIEGEGTTVTILLPRLLA